MTLGISHQQLLGPGLLLYLVTGMNDASQDMSSLSHLLRKGDVSVQFTTARKAGIIRLAGGRFRPKERFTGTKQQSKCSMGDTAVAETAAWHGIRPTRSSRFRTSLLLQYASSPGCPSRMLSFANFPLLVTYPVFCLSLFLSLSYDFVFQLCLLVKSFA